MIENLSIILVSPQGDANIGAAARAMKNFGATDLRLVNPVEYKTDASYSWAVSARDILDNATVYDSLQPAISDLCYTLAYTRRLGRDRKKSMTVREAADKIVSFLGKGKVGIIFGNEESGLSNDEASLADEIVHIPTSEKLPSVNLAQSVILACHEIFYKTQGKTTPSTGNEIEKYATKKDVIDIIFDLERTLVELGYEDTKDRPVKTKIMNQFNKLFGRAGLTEKDKRMFQGLLSRISSRIIP